MNLRTIEATAFVPTKDLSQSKCVDQELAIKLVCSTDELASFRHGASVLRLQDFHVAGHLAKFKTRLLVEDVDAARRRVDDRRPLASQGVHAQLPAGRPCELRDFTLLIPGDVLWRIGPPLAQ